VAYTAGTKRQAASDLPAEVQFSGEVNIDNPAATSPKEPDVADSASANMVSTIVVAAAAVALAVL